MEFVHPRLDEMVEAVGGHYLFTKEDNLAHGRGNIIYFVGYAVTDRACCGLTGCGYAVVAGHIVSPRYRTDKENRIISLINPIEEDLFEEIAKSIRLKEGVSQVLFLREGGGSRVLF
ncbi:MAG TPA: hypothetical protein VMU10_03705 [Desulfomonilia bacterium]|nr:hypothetical protein [Desulfomonilia bacterium]